MIKKNDLIALLKKGLDAEEKGIPIYTKHLANVVFLSGLAEKDQERIKNILLTLKKDSEGHKAVLQTLINKIQESKKDVF